MFIGSDIVTIDSTRGLKNAHLLNLKDNVYFAKTRAIQEK